MIKAVVRNKEGNPTLILGITKQNIHRMKNGEPIYFDLSKLGYELVKKGDETEPSAILIMTGRTEKTIAAQLGIENLDDPLPGQEVIVRIDDQEDHQKNPI